jgi:hypothetical protein
MITIVASTVLESGEEAKKTQQKMESNTINQYKLILANLTNHMNADL